MGSQGQHKAKRYHTGYYMFDILGVNAMLQCWAIDAQVLAGQHALLWVFHHYIIGSVMNKLMLEQLNSNLIVPKFTRHWTAMLAHLPVIAQNELSYPVVLYTICSRSAVSMQEMFLDTH